MQSGVTGINSIHIYSPGKQARDQDPAGIFIRRYVPELANTPDAYLAEPHLMPPIVAADARFRIGDEYPEPIVDAAEAVKLAKLRIYEVRRRAESRAEAKAVYVKHGSRKPAPPRRTTA